MKTFQQWLEAIVNLAHANYDDVYRIKRSSDDKINAVMTVLKPFVDPSNHEILGHGLRSQDDVERVFKLGLQAPNQIFHRIVATVFESGVPLENQPREAFDGLLQWPFARRTDIVLIAAPQGNPDSIWRPIRDDEEKSHLATALGGVKFTIDPKHILGFFDAENIRFTPNA